MTAIFIRTRKLQGKAPVWAEVYDGTVRKILRKAAWPERTP